MTLGVTKDQRADCLLKQRIHLMMSPDQEELTIKVGGQVLGGWLRIRVTRGVELLPSHFDIETTERFPGQLSQVSADPTSPCEISLSGDLVLTGYIDRYMPIYNKTRHTVRLIGRSKTEDIVDCSVDPKALGNVWQIDVNTIKEYATKICNLFNIRVVLPDGDATIPGQFAKQLTIYPGYTAYFLIEEMARSVGMLVWDDEKGNLVISKVGTKRAGSSVVEGLNAERVEVVFGADQRFAYYRVLAMGPSQVDSHIKYDATATDPEPSVLRNRLRIIPQELPDPGEAYSNLRAQWEANRRFGRSRVARVHVVGWRDGQGKLWTPNTIVNVQLPTAKVKEDRIISEVTWLRGEEGTQSLLTLMPAKALSVQPFTIKPAVPT